MARPLRIELAGGLDLRSHNPRCSRMKTCWNRRGKQTSNVISRVARVRGIGEKKVAALVRVLVRDRQFGILGEPTVHVLRLNMALDAMR